MTGAEIVAVAALVFSGIAAIGVGWQIFRAEQIFPLAGTALHVIDRGATAYIHLEHGKQAATYPLRSLEIHHYGREPVERQGRGSVRPHHGRLGTAAAVPGTRG